MALLLDVCSVKVAGGRGGGEEGGAARRRGRTEGVRGPARRCLDILSPKNIFSKILKNT